MDRPFKFELARPTDYSEEALLNEIRRVSNVVNKPLTRTKFDNNSKHKASTIEKRFGSWLSALEKAGLDTSYWHLGNKKISTDEIINELKRVSTALNTDTFSRKEFVDNSILSQYIFKGDNSFNKLMKLAGLNVPLKSRKYTDQECFENLLNVWTYYGRQPSYSEIKIAPSIVGAKAYIIRWGGWTKALIAFLEQVNSDLTESKPDIVTENIVPIERKKMLPEDRREIPLGLRYDILKRDKFACVNCGRMPKTHNISLQVDHIIAWTKGGKTVEQNLRTLCNECNNGKSDKDE